MQQQLLPHFRIKKITEVQIEEISDLAECISKYMPKAEPSHSEIHTVLSRIHRTIQNGVVWFLYEGKTVVGFLAISVAQDTYGERFWLAEDFFTMRGEIYLGQAKRLVDMGVAWVKRSDVKKIIFLTKRNPKAMIRFLPGKWEIDSTVISFEVKENAR